VLALAGRVAEPVAAVLDVPMALPSAEEKVIEAPGALDVVALDDDVVDDDVVDGGVNAVWRLVICESICETRERMSV
jgi:hypothetical protein